MGSQTSPRGVPPKLLLPIVLVAFALVPALALRLEPMAYEGGRSRNVRDRQERNSSAFAAMLGEFRTSLSDILFVKTERYLDSGIAYAAHGEGAALSVEDETARYEQNEAEASAGAHDHGGEEHAGTATLIRAPEQDFRGFIGELHRQVKPWRDPSEGHHHTTGKELLPWYRVMTVADPHNARAYAVGAWWLKSENVDQGIAFLHEGIEKNPNEFLLPYLLGQLYAEKARQLARGGAAENEIQAVNLMAQDAYETGALLGLEALKTAPNQDELSGDSVDFILDDVLGSARLAVMYEKRYGDPTHALALGERVLSQVNDNALRRIIAPLKVPVEQPVGGLTPDE